MPHTTSWFYGAVLAGILSVLRAEGLDALVYQVADNTESRTFFADLPVQRQVDAVIVVAFPSPTTSSGSWTCSGCPSSSPAGRC